MRCTFLLTISCLLLAGDARSEPTTPKAEAPALALSVKESSGQIIVTVKNVSTKPVRLCEMWNSWGYQMIWFDVRDASKNEYRIQAADQKFTKNGPTYFTVGPGKQKDIPIRLDDRWLMSVPLAHAMNGELSLRANLDIYPTPESNEHGVWTGRVESGWHTIDPPHRWLGAK